MKQKAKEPDWKAIAGELYQRVKKAVVHLRTQGDTGGFFINLETGEEKHWKDDFADAMELIPGVKINREVMHAYSLPRRERDKVLARLAKAKKGASKK
jgi:hypothetical protein